MSIENHHDRIIQIADYINDYGDNAEMGGDLKCRLSEGLNRFQHDHTGAILANLHERLARLGQGKEGEGVGCWIRAQSVLGNPKPRLPLQQ